MLHVKYFGTLYSYCGQSILVLCMDIGLMLQGNFDAFQISLKYSGI